MKTRYISPLFALLLSLPAYAAKVIAITDGDTLTVLHNRQPLKIRLANIDAPEKKQAFGQVSKKSLADLCFGREAAYDGRTTDRYGRRVARVTCAGIDVNRTQVERGMAWVYDNYNKERSLLSVQAAAKSSRKGLWRDRAPVPPWEFRRPVVRSVAGKSSCITGPKGGRYQVIDGRKRYGC